MRKRETKEIGEYKYEVTQLGAREASAAFIRIQKLMKDASGDMDHAIAALSADDLAYFQDIFAAQTRLIVTVTDDDTGNTKAIAKPLKPEFDNHFAGDNLFDMVEWLRFCLGFNFGPFFLKLMAEIEQAKIAAEKEKQASNAQQIGLSGVS